MIIITALTLISLGACGINHSLGEFAPIAYQFEAEAASRGKDVRVDDITIEYGDLDGDVTGYCEWGLFKNNKTITLDKQYWDSANSDAREILLFHELGHCVLERSYHNNRVDERGNPVSIMNERTMKTKVYTNNRKKYLDELFSIKGGGI